MVVTQCRDCGPAHECLAHENERLRERVANLENLAERAAVLLDGALRAHVDALEAENARLRERIAELEAAHRAANIELKAALLAGIADLAGGEHE